MFANVNLNVTVLANVEASSVSLDKDFWFSAALRILVSASLWIWCSRFCLTGIDWLLLFVVIFAGADMQIRVKFKAIMFEAIELRQIQPRTKMKYLKSDSFLYFNFALVVVHFPNSYFCPT